MKARAIGQLTRVIGRKFIQNTLTHFNQSTRSDKAIPLLQEMQKIKSIELGSKAASKASILILDDDEMQNKR